ncbi:4-aminobutyrate aminotransferase PuuE (plasmid) [Asticcacaulis sp. MM231]|uniref:4-aminobutyrate--2-oxoglutarate transaminase n=1 Tax=Asticcacaulis sp. MM231 TaxID=3157666 RepID=UPI0032D583DA
MSTNAELYARRVAAIPKGVVNGLQVFAARAENAEIWDIEGRRYIDFAAGIAVCNTGHRHPKVVAAVEAQLKTFSHTAFQVMPYEGYITLAERLNALAPISSSAKTIFFNTGAEAVENAVKIARAATGRTGIIAFSGAFHGRTLMTTALTGKVAPYKKLFGTLPGEIWRVPFPVESYGVSVEDSLKMLDSILRTDADPDQVAAIIIEPVQGEGGFHIAPAALLQALRKVCDTHGILLIADEVQTGFGRTGKMFAIQHSGVEPDLVTMAKALGGGFPISGVVGRAEIMDVIDGGGLGSTFGGAPLSCAAALAVLDVIEDENLVARAQAIGERMRYRFVQWSQRNDLLPVTNVRGLGAMNAFSLPDADAVKAVIGKAFAGGLIQISCGVFGEALRFLPALTISDTLIDEGLDILEGALAK